MGDKFKKTISKISKMVFHIINIVLIGFTFIMSLISIFKKEWIEMFIEWMKVLINSLGFWNYIIALTSSFIEAFPVLWVVVPWQNILLIVWWFFWNVSWENLFFVWVIASIWAILGNYVWYLLWKIYWDSFFQKYWIWFWIWLTEVKYLKKWMEKWWALWIIFWKFHPITRAFLPFIAWSTGMNNKKFMLYNTIGSIIRAVSIILLWVVFVEYYKIILEHFWKIMLVIFAWIGFYIYKYKKAEFMKYMDEKNKELEWMSK